MAVTNPSSLLTYDTTPPISSNGAKGKESRKDGLRVRLTSFKMKTLLSGREPSISLKLTQESKGSENIATILSIQVICADECHL